MQDIIHSAVAYFQTAARRSMWQTAVWRLVWLGTSRACTSVRQTTPRYWPVLQVLVNFFPLAIAFSIWLWYNVFAMYINFTCLCQMAVTTPPAVKTCKFLRTVLGSVRGTWSLPQAYRPCVSTTSPATSSASWMGQVSIK